MHAIINKANLIRKITQVNDKPHIQGIGNMSMVNSNTGPRICWSQTYYKLIHYHCTVFNNYVSSE